MQLKGKRATQSNFERFLLSARVAHILYSIKHVIGFIKQDAFGAKSSECQGIPPVSWRYSCCTLRNVVSDGCGQSGTLHLWEGNRSKESKVHL